ncbi:hypothetical protein [Deinococcus puniceus]|uniref:Uncharacterized protein n=1 Tax=Deinococcus puniceus TaxID=1182568 RepID=A0A172TBA1_9DEIO|nr:hypothetical protein [Deinococcus puniceus]ANE44236.1 hypothetical protein SU48_11210 [Deinococcus puniceus]
MSRVRFVTKAIPSDGGRVWNRKTERWWGELCKEYPATLLAELNGAKRSPQLVTLINENRKPRN